MSFYQYGSTKYILLKDIKLDLGIGVEAKRGEVLEGFNQPSRGCLPALFDRSRGIAFSCSAEAAAILTHEEAGYLTGIVSLEDRYNAFKEGVAFDRLPDVGSKVFVAIRGREFPGVVRAVSLFCDQQFKPVFKVGIQRHITEAEAPMTCQCSTSGFGPKEILMVIASLDMLRPRNEASEVSHECVPAGYQERWLGSISSGKAENLPVGVIEEPDSNRFMDEQRGRKHDKRKVKELNERENELNQRNITGLEYIANEHWVQETETTQAEEWPGHEQTNKNPKESGEKLSRDQEEEGFGENDKKEKPVFGIIAADESKQEEKTEDESNEVQWKPEEKEKEVIGVQQTEDESKKEEKIKDELKEIQFKLDCAIKDKEKAEKKVQKYKEELEELQTTLAEAQSLLKKKPKTESECEWNLSRKEIRLTEKKLGSGSFGTVFKGMFRGTQVAVKQVSVKPKITEYNMKNFQREMRMAARCRHPCMLQFIGATSDDQSPLLVTELMDTSLKAVLLDRELHPIEIKTIALDVAKGLNYLHLTQPYPIVHRDISSGNVLLWQHGQSLRGKISDYGNAVLMNYARTGSGGALSYLAPEMDNQKFSTKSDVYSFGVLLLEMCLRQEPSSQDDRGSLVCTVEDGAMRQLIRRCIKPDPKQRPCMKEVLAVLTPTSELIEGSDGESGDIFQVDIKP